MPRRPATRSGPQARQHHGGRGAHRLVDGSGGATIRSPPSTARPPPGSGGDSGCSTARPLGVSSSRTTRIARQGGPSSPGPRRPPGRRRTGRAAPARSASGWQRGPGLRRPRRLGLAPELVQPASIARPWAAVCRLARLTPLDSALTPIAAHPGDELTIPTIKPIWRPGLETSGRNPLAPRRAAPARLWGLRRGEP